MAIIATTTGLCSWSDTGNIDFSEPLRGRCMPANLVRSSPECVAKLFEDETDKSLNQICALALSLESMLRLATLKTVLQHIHPISRTHSQAGILLTLLP